MMVFANCLSALWMEDRSFGACVALAVAVLVVTVGLSTLTGLVITASGVPDIIVTLAASFILAGLALFVIGRPGGGTSPDFQRAGRRRPVRVLAVGAVDRRRARRSCGSRCAAAASAWPSTPSAATARRRSCPASTSPGRASLAYSIGGLFAGFAGLVITASTGGGEPRATIGTNATLNSVAAVVLGGVALTGGVGGLAGPVLAALCLTLIPAIMLGLGWDPSNAETARGVIIILVVLVAGLLQTTAARRVSDMDTDRHRRRRRRRRPQSRRRSWPRSPTQAARPGWRVRLAEQPTLVLAGVLAVLYAVTAWQDDSLLTTAGVRSILLLACPLAIFAASQTLCMLTGGIDLSIAMTANLAAYVAATESGAGHGPGAGPGAGRRTGRRLRQRPGHRRVPGQPADHDAGHGQRAAGHRHRRAAGVAGRVDERARPRAPDRLGGADRAAAEERDRVGRRRRRARARPALVRAWGG